MKRFLTTLSPLIFKHCSAGAVAVLGGVIATAGNSNVRVHPVAVFEYCTLPCLPCLHGALGEAAQSFLSPSVVRVLPEPLAGDSTTTAATVLY